MAITGVLSEFSLPEIFQFLERGHKTGRLTIQPLSELPDQKEAIHYIWFHIGRVVAAADCLDHQGLYRMMNQRGWVSDRIISKFSLMCSTQMPIGLCLKSQGILQAEQLKLLFYGQVVRQVTALFKLQDARFQFDSQSGLPISEMTGLSLPATEVTIMGLRALRDWTALTDKLPEQDSTLVSLTTGKPALRLDTQEWQIWEFVNGTMPLKAIAAQLGLPTEKVQQIAFRLIVANLAEEVPVIETMLSPTTEQLPESTSASSEASAVSHSFLQNLMGFLRSKV